MCDFCEDHEKYVYEPKWWQVVAAIVVMLGAVWGGMQVLKGLFGWS